MKEAPKSVTIRWLARHAGVSVATISRALRHPDRVAPETRERILKLVSRYQFVPDGRAATFSSRRTGLVGLVVPTISNSIYAEFTEAIQNRLQAAGLSLLIANANYSAEIEAGIIRKLIESRVEGVILTGYKRDAALYNLLRHYRIPFVVTWSTSPEPAIPSISFDNYAAATEAVEMLISLGHRRIGLICGVTDINDRAAQRFDAYRSALLRHKIRFEPELVSEQPFEIEVSAEAATRLVTRKNPPTALFCANDIQALGALFACQRLNVRVPEDISLIGFDDLPITRVVNPPLSSVHVPAKLMGQAAADALIDAARNGIPVTGQTVGTELMMRGSTAPAASANTKIR
ncbi:substrate-binding domain-containing protein [Bradyrhizobium sp.]|uniref:LacI family DNA-binding transcriptional regulator n=1 Tax=Bradyrhizobium sp. TaxID=376 RepID=UPI0025BB5235|nr:substrate-binding domain-containing protein [Bradyrhizobium sp.]